MDSQKLQYIIELLQQGDTKGAVQQIKNVQDQAAKTDAALDALAATAKTALASIGSALAIQGAIDSYVDYEHAVARLSGTLKATGQDSASFRAELAAQAKGFSQTTNESKKTILGIQTLLVSFGATRQQLPQLTQAVLDLSAGMGIDANTAAFELSKSLEGVDGPLRRMGITFDANAGLGEKFSSAIKQIESRFGGLAVALKNTDAGKLNDLDKAMGGLKKTVGELALDAFQPAIERGTQLALVTKDFLSNGSLAGEYTKELLVIASTLTALTAGTKGFGMAWEFVAGDAIKQAGGLKEALASIPKTIQIAIIAAAVYQIGQATKEAVAALKAGDQETSSASDLSAQNSTRRAAIEKMIDQAEQSKKIGGKQADDMRLQISDAFTPKTNYQYSYGGGMVAPIATTAIDPGAASSALSKVFQSLTGYGSRPGGSQATTGLSAAALQAQKDGLAEIAKLQQKMSADALEGFDKQRADAENLYDTQAADIANNARKNGLTDDQIKSAKQQNQDELYANFQKIDQAQQQQETEHILQVAQLKAQMRVEGLTGLQKEIAVENERYQLAIAHVNALKDLSPEDKTSLLSLNDQAHKNATKSFDQARPNDDLKVFEEQLTQSTIGSSEQRVQTAQREYDARVAYYQQLLAQGKITEGGLTQLLQDAAKTRAQILAPAVEQGKIEGEKLIAAKTSLWQQHVVDVNKAFDTRKANLTAYYDWLIEKDKDSVSQQLTDEQNKQAALAQLDQQRKQATSQLYQDLTKIGSSAETDFADGFSNAFLSFIDGTKSAGQAFEQFAGEFLQQIAQMILQMIILRTVQAAVSGIGGFLGIGGGGGDIASGAVGGLAEFSGGTSALADGGMRVRYAAHGIMLAASGMAGVSQVNGPTYFPNYNVLAGEAGSEMMTVLSKPSSTLINGMPAITGKAQGTQLAIMSMDNLSRMVHSGNPSLMASGGVAGGAISTLATKQTAQPNGKIVVELTPHPAYEQRIVSNSIRGAQAQVASDLQTDTPIRRAAKTTQL